MSCRIWRYVELHLSFNVAKCMHEYFYSALLKQDFAEGHQQVLQKNMNDEIWSFVKRCDKCQRGLLLEELRKLVCETIWLQQSSKN